MLPSPTPPGSTLVGGSRKAITDPHKPTVTAASNRNFAVAAIRARTRTPAHSGAPPLAKMKLDSVTATEKPFGAGTGALH